MIITRYHKTLKLELTVEFLTPTFLGGADQHGELRTAPFKNLLRQWWRVTVGHQHTGHRDLLRKEGELFGSVLEGGKASASKVRLELTPVANCDPSALDADINNQLGRTDHPEVKRGNPISNAMYLGFGPLSRPPKRCLRAGSRAKLILTYPETYADEIKTTLEFIHTFGTIGSRSRNGWGSLFLSGDGITNKQPADFFNLAAPLNELIAGNSAKKYPSRLGKDQRGILCWETTGAQAQQWTPVMKMLAENYLKVRTSLRLRSSSKINERHILGYPVTHHNVAQWGGNRGRMPSQLRLMVKKNRSGQLVGRILHLPHKLPKPWDVSLEPELNVWEKVHHVLDNKQEFIRCGS